MHSTVLYNLSTLGYVASLGIFAIHVVRTRKFLVQLGLVIIAISFLMQTLGLLFRWTEAGSLEVIATERALGYSLSGLSWFVVFTQHPPWSNLYEIMVYMSWGVILVTLVCEIRFGISWIRKLGPILALMALGMASLTDATISPLVPALKSWWIMIHVISASIAYSAGSIAAFLCFFALLKDTKRVEKTKLVGGALVFFGFLLFCIAGGPRLFIEQSYFVKLLAYAGESVISVVDLSKEGNPAYFVAVPIVGWLMIICCFTHVAGGLFIWSSKFNNKFMQKNINNLYIFCFGVLLLNVSLIIFFNIINLKINVPAGGHHLSPAGPYFIGFKSHTWAFGLLILLFIFEIIILAYLIYPSWLLDRLPQVDLLEQASYKAISLSFFLMTIVLVTGCLWAHYAWGRYWAWDPKETGALVIWLNYAIYLHAKRTKGLSGPISSIIGVLGFFIILIGFLGVNLGLFADGLHTYGSN